MQQLTILSDVEEFLPPLSPEEFEGLKADILANGCNDALVVWNDTIIDGHNRYAICTENNIPFQTREMTFESIDDAKMWILANQSSRRNMTAYARTVIALRMKPAFEEKAKRRQSAAGGDHGNQYTGGKVAVVPNSEQPAKKTIEQIASLAKVGKDTVSKIEYIEANADEETKAQLRRGDKGVSVNGVYTKLKEENAAIKVVPSTELTVMEPVEAVLEKEENYLDSVPQWEPSVTLNQISCVDPDPLVGAIFELFPEEYRSKFFSAFFDRFLYWQGKEETETLFIQMAQALSNSTNEGGYREKT